MIKIKLICVLISSFLLTFNYAYSQTSEDLLKDKLFIKSLENIGEKKWEVALITLQTLQKKYPKNFIVLNNLALVNFYVDNYTKSRDLFEKAMNNDNVCKVIYENINKIKQYKTSSFYREITKSNERLNQPQLEILESDSIVYQTIFSTAYVNVSNSNDGAVKSKVAQDLDREKEQRKIILLQNRIKELTKQVKSLNGNKQQTKVSAVKNEKVEAQVETEIKKNMKGWKKAWSAGKVKQYLNFYASNFKPAGKDTFKKWVAKRKARIYPSRKIRLNYTITAMKMNTNSKLKSVLVDFTQKYQSINFKSTGKKTILWQQQKNGEWKIAKEYNRNKS